MPWIFAQTQVTSDRKLWYIQDSDDLLSERVHYPNRRAAEVAAEKLNYEDQLGKSIGFLPGIIGGDE